MSAFSGCDIELRDAIEKLVSEIEVADLFSAIDPDFQEGIDTAIEHVRRNLRRLDFEELKKVGAA